MDRGPAGRKHQDLGGGHTAARGPFPPRVTLLLIHLVKLSPIPAIILVTPMILMLPRFEPTV